MLSRLKASLFGPTTPSATRTPKNTWHDFLAFIKENGSDQHRAELDAALAKCVGSYVPAQHVIYSIIGEIHAQQGNPIEANRFHMLSVNARRLVTWSAHHTDNDMKNTSQTPRL